MHARTWGGPSSLAEGRRGVHRDSHQIGHSKPLSILAGPPELLLQPPILSLGCLIALPILAALAPRIGAVGLLAGAAFALLVDGGREAMAMLAITAPAAVLLRLAVRGGLPRPWMVAGWLALWQLPAWLPELGDRLAAAGSAPAPPGAAWAAWPAAPLASAEWDPLVVAPFYATWGSQTLVARPGAWLPAAILGALAAALYFVQSRRDSAAPASPR